MGSGFTFFFWLRPVVRRIVGIARKEPFEGGDGFGDRLHFISEFGNDFIEIHSRQRFTKSGYMYHHCMVQTPWGTVPISDAHVHFFSHGFYSELASQKHLGSAEELQPLLSWDIPEADPVQLAERWVRELNQKRVARACLISSIPGDEASVSAAVGAHPERFYGHFMVNPLAEDARGRLRTAADNPNLHCICLFPAMHGFSVADAHVQSTLEIAAECGFTVFVHCGSMSVGVRKRLGLPSPFEMRHSNPLDLHSVAMRYPRIRFVIPHFGAGLFREALMLADLCPNVFIDTSSSNRWMIYEGLNLREVFRRTLAVTGPSRLLFGTDSSFFPRGWQDGLLKEQMSAMLEAGVDQAAAVRILGGNLEELHAPRAAYFAAGTQT
jgi:uncharacterized protein